MKASVKTQRFKFPEIKQMHENNHQTDKIVLTETIGKPFIFTADKFLSDEEIKEFELSEPALFLGQADKAPSEIVNRGKQIKADFTQTEPDLITENSNNLDFLK